MAEQSNNPWSDFQAMSQQFWNAWAQQAAPQSAAAWPPGATPPGWNVAGHAWNPGMGAPGASAAWHPAGLWPGFAQQAPAWTQAAAASPSAAWPNAEAWAKAFVPPPSAQNDVVERMTAGAREFMGFLQAAANAAQGSAGGWSEALQQAASAMSGASNSMLDALRAMGGPGATSFDEIAAQSERAFAPMQRELAAWMSLPTFGYSREQQARAQQLARATMALQQTQAAYQALMLKASKDAFGKLETKLAERSEPGRELTSMRALYDLYIDAAEEAYAEIALSPEFQAAYGAMTNAQMRHKKLVNEAIERHTETLGMPTRKELDSVHQRLAEARRRIAALEDALHGAGGKPVAVDVANVDAADTAAHPGYGRDQPRQASKTPRGDRGQARRK